MIRVLSKAELPGNAIVDSTSQLYLQLLGLLVTPNEGSDVQSLLGEIHPYPDYITVPTGSTPWQAPVEAFACCGISVVLQCNWSASWADIPLISHLMMTSNTLSDSGHLVEV